MNGPRGPHSRATDWRSPGMVRALRSAGGARASLPTASTCAACSRPSSAPHESRSAFERSSPPPARLDQRRSFTRVRRPSSGPARSGSGPRARFIRRWRRPSTCRASSCWRKSTSTRSRESSGSRVAPRCRAFPPCSGTWPSSSRASCRRRAWRLAFGRLGASCSSRSCSSTSTKGPRSPRTRRAWRIRCAFAPPIERSPMPRSQRCTRRWSLRRSVALRCPPGYEAGTPGHSIASPAPGPARPRPAWLGPGLCRGSPARPLCGAGQAPESI